MSHDVDPTMPFPPLRPPNQALAGVFGNQELQQLRCDFDALKGDVERLISWCNGQRKSFDELIRLKLQPGDIVLARVPNPITAAQGAAIKEQLERTFPGHKCVIVTAGMEIAAVTEVPKS